MAMVAQTASALTVKNVKTWYWTTNTYIESVAWGDVDSDGKVEIVTGGYFRDGTRNDAQLCVWNSQTMALENVRVWYWVYNTPIYSVAVGDVDGDGKVEIVTGGCYDGGPMTAQLCVWNGATLALESVKTWYWGNYAAIYSVAVGDADNDGANEIVTGGYYHDGTRTNAQLCVWNGATLSLENVKTWYSTSGTFIESVAVGDVDADGKNEIVTGGYYYDDFRDNAQLCVWNGATLALEKAQTWYWTRGTHIKSVVVGDVDADGKNEIVTGGWYTDNAISKVAQLCVWDDSTLALKNVKTWQWGSDTVISSVAVGDPDGDGKNEIVTGGYYDDVDRYVAQLCVWDGATLALKNVKTWYWNSGTYIRSIAVGDVDADSKAEIVTGGEHFDLHRWVAQLCVWAW